MLALSALAEPTRFRIVEMLAAYGDMAVSQISRHFPTSPPAISQHLKVLKEAKLVRVKVQAQQRIYSLDTAGISELEKGIGQLRVLWEGRLNALDELLKEEVKTAHNEKK
jgi:DNA-binding transcriptional ArsR family regulator